VILLRNMDPEHGLCNGTRMTIVRIARNVLETKILTGEFAGQKRLIPRIKLNSAQEDFAYIISRIQFPLRLCFSMTINKSQGQSFERVGVDLRAPPFSHGQFYVAMSRVTDVRRLSILTLPPDAGNRDNKILECIMYSQARVRGLFPLVLYTLSLDQLLSHCGERLAVSTRMNLSITRF